MRHLRLLAALLPLALAGGAAADSVVIPLTVRPGTLALASTRVVVAGAKAEAAVVDARGTGAGWQLVVLPPRRALMVTGVQVRCGARSTCTLPPPGQRFPLALAPFRPTVVFAAGRGTGMGTIDLTLRLSGQVAGTALQLAVRPA